MRTPAPLPPALATGAFSVAEAARLGVSSDRLAASDLQRPFRGVRAREPLPAALAYAPLLRPGDRFSHTTSLYLLDAPLPTARERDVHVTLRTSQRAPALGPPRTRGVFGHTSSVGGILMHGGLPLSDPVTAFLESASILSVDDLVAVGDSLVLDPRVLDPALLRPLTTVDALRSAAAASHGRGVVRARAAAALVREGVESPKETVLRLLLVRAGIPEPVCGYELRSAGRRIGWFDLAWPQFRVIAEYDGDDHRTKKAQYEKDIRRYDAAADLDWRVVRVRIPGLGPLARDTVARVERALVRLGWSR